MGCLLISTGLLAGDRAVPSLEFLEFLADGKELDEQLMDPLSLQEMEDDEKTPAQPVTAPKPVKGGTP